MGGKKKSIPIYRKPWFPYAMGIIGVPTLTLIWANIGQVWGAPAEIKSVKEAVIQNSNTQAQMVGMIQEQKEKNAQQDAEIEKGKEVSQLQIDSLKALLAVMKR